MFLLVLLLVQFNNCVAFKPRPELLGLPLTSGETCLAHVKDFIPNTATNVCKIFFSSSPTIDKLDRHCLQYARHSSQIKDCPKCNCLNGMRANDYSISVMVPRINPQLEERMSKSNTFQLAGLTVPDALYHVTISVVGISIIGLVAYIPSLFLVPLKLLGIAWLMLLGISYLFILCIGPPTERELHEHFEIAIMGFVYAIAKSISFILEPLSDIPRSIWHFPDHMREEEIAATIGEKVYAFELGEFSFRALGELLHA